MDSITKIQIAWSLWKEGIKAEQLASRLDIDRATAYRWISKFKTKGLKRTLKDFKNAKKGRRRSKKTKYEVKLKVYEIRNKYHNCCGEKIKYYLLRDHNIKLSVSTIYNILREKYQLTKKYKQRKYGEAPKGTKPREVIQADTVDFGDIYAYTYIDTYTRQAIVDLELDLESESGLASLTVATDYYKDIELIQTDGGSEFEGEFKRNVLEYAKKHRVSRPYKKNEQSFIESFNRTLRKECLGWRKYRIEELAEAKRRVKKFLEFYNNERPHLGIGMAVPNSRDFCRI